MEHEITVLHAEQIVPQGMSKSSPLRTSNDFQSYLQQHLGCYCICEFSLGNGQSRTQKGILQEIGQNYFLLYREDTDTTTACLGTSLQFITCYRPNSRP